MVRTIIGLAAPLLWITGCADARALPMIASRMSDTIPAADGRVVVTTLCAACHLEQASPKLAPPLSQVSRVYRAALTEREAVVARMTAWIKGPNKNRALMPASDIRRFGLMPALPLPDEQLRSASTFVWTLSEPSPATAADSGGPQRGVRHR